MAFATQFTVFIIIVLAFRLFGFVCQKWHDWLTSQERAESMENKSSATTATFLKPLASLLPLLGYLVGFQRFFAGVRRQFWGHLNVRRRAWHARTSRA